MSDSASSTSTNAWLLAGTFGTYTLGGLGLFLLGRWLFTRDGYGKRLSTTIYSVASLVRVSDHDFIAAAGLDAHAFVRGYAIGFKLTLLFIPAGWFVLVPVYASGADDDGAAAGDLADISMGHVKQGSDFLWLSVAMVYMLTAFTLLILYREFACFVAHRQRVLRAADDPQCRAVFVRELPKALGTPSQLAHYFATVYGELEAVVPIFAVPGMDAWVARRAAVAQELEGALSARDPDARPSAAAASAAAASGLWPRALASCGCGVGRTDQQIVALKRELDALNGRVSSAQSEVRRRMQTSTPALGHGGGDSAPQAGKGAAAVRDRCRAATVVFKTAAAATLATRTPLTLDALSLMVSPASDWRDVDWQQFELQWSAARTRQLLAVAAVWWLNLVWAVPSAAVSSLGNVTTVEVSVEASACTCPDSTHSLARGSLTAR